MKDLDEREMKITGKNASIIILIVIFYLIVSSTYKVLTTKDFGSISTEMCLLVLILFSFVFLNRKLARLFLPESVTGKTLPTGKTSKEKKIRLFSYLVDAALGAALITSFEFIAYHFFGVTEIVEETGFLSDINELSVFTLFGSFFCFLILNYISGELSIRRYNKKLLELEQ